MTTARRFPCVPPLRRAPSGPGVFRSGLALASGMLALAVAVSPAWAAELTVRFAGLDGSPGVLMIGVYDSAPAFRRALDLYDEPDGFIRDRGRIVGMAIRLNVVAPVAVFRGLKPGRYAVVAFHDRNMDGRLDKTLLGVPKEGYGFSRGARGLLGPPDFRDAAIDLPASGRTITVRLEY